MRIEKKIWKEYFEKVVSGDKTFEIRLADFDCSIGDVLVLKEWDPEKKVFTGRVLEKEITPISKTKNVTFWTREDIEKYGLQIIGFR